MTIKGKLAVSWLITVSSLLVFFALLTWGGLKYAKFTKSVENINLQVQSWHQLNFLVSVYLRENLEAILAKRPIQEKNVVEAAGEIAQIFVEMERNILERQLSGVEFDWGLHKERLSVVRSEFGDLSAATEAAAEAYERGRVQQALSTIASRIRMKSLDKRFASLIEIELWREQKLFETRLVDLDNFRQRLIWTFAFAAIFALGFCSVLMFRINLAVGRSIARARSELLRGTGALAAGEFETKIDLHASDELAVVAEAFNKMSSDLEAAWKTIRDQQQQIIASSKMSALGEMAGGVAHEINNPLTIIKNLASLVEDAVKDDPLDREAIQNMLRRIDATVDRIAKIIRGLRSFSRDGSSDPLSDVGLKELFSETLALSTEKFKNEGVELVLESVPPELGVRARQVELSQVLLNLLNNAFDAVRGQEIKWIRVSVVEEKDFVQIQVADSGKGISPEIREKIFQPFFTTKEIGKGVGLGLSISVGIIENCQGTLTLDTNSDQTRFVVRLRKSRSVQWKRAG